MAQHNGRTSLGRRQSTKRPAAHAARGIRPLYFYLAVATLMMTNATALVGFFMSPDIARIVGGQNELVVAGYENRIAELRAEVDKLYSRQYARTGDLNLQLQDLVQQQDELVQQHQYVKALADMARDLGIATPKSTAQADPVKAPQPAALTPARLDLSQLQNRVHAMNADTAQAMDVLETSVETSTSKLLSGLRSLGLSPALNTDGNAVGGPFEPDSTDAPSAMLDKANALYDEFVRFKTARDALRLAPVHAPLTGRMRVSSGFGTRSDPFLHKSAFHGGIDFPRPTGTPVSSAAAGKVSFAGTMSGYGNLVEITHKNGLKTRYGHLSAILVRKGETVGEGELIGKVGSTGRSTGPHLHFEVRRAGKPINPGPFLSVGRQLSAFL